MDRSRLVTRRQAARMTGSRDRGPGNTERSGEKMFVYEKKLQYPVRIQERKPAVGGNRDFAVWRT